MVKNRQFPLSRGRLLIFCMVVVLAVTSCSLPTSDDQNSQQVEVSGVPEVRIVSPANNATYLEGVTVPIQASIANAGTDIERVEIIVDGAVVATFPQPNPSGARVFSLTQPWPISAQGAHSISVSAFRADGTASVPAEVSISIISQAGQGASPTNTMPAQPQTQPTTDTQVQAQATNAQQPTDAPTDAPAPTDPPPPTDPPTPSKPMAHMAQGVNVRSGPDTYFGKIGSLAANVDTELLAVSPGGGWYKIVYYNGEGWVIASAVQISVDVNTLPIDPGPPTPVPTAIPPTAVPATPVPTSNVNLVVTNVIIEPHPFVCGNSSSVKVVVTNNGSAAAADGGTILLQDIHEADSAVDGTTSGTFPALAAGASYTSQMFLRVDAYINESHITVVTLDSDNKIVESNEGDNKWTLGYVLAKGSCP